jgi:hypothetical protein
MKYPANFDGGPVMDDEGGITIWISSLNPKEEDV